MATEQQTRSHDVAYKFLHELGRDRTALDLWVRDGRDHVELWLVTEPITHEQELHLYGIVATLYEQFPHAYPELHVIHKGLYDSPDFVFDVPEGAEHITSLQ